MDRANLTMDGGPIFIGADLGGSMLKMVDLEAKDDSFVRVLVSAVRDIGELLEAIRSHVEVLARGGRMVSGIGLGVPGILGVKGELIYSPHRPELVGLELQTEIAGVCGIWPVVMNDAACAAVVESLRWPDSQTLVVNFGTGVGSAMSYGGKVLRGSNGAFGEIGHTGRYSTSKCACGRIGCFEEALRELLPHRVHGAIGYEEAHSASYRSAVELVASGLHDAVMLLDPAQLVLGGGLMIQNPNIFTDVSMALSDALSEHNRPHNLRIHNSSVDEYSGAVGAALIAAGRIGYV